MTEQTVCEWLSDYASLSPEELHTFATCLEHNQELVLAIYAVLENRESYQKLIDPVCNQLFAFYRSREIELQRFTLQFLPTLIYVYLNSVASGKKKSCWSVETLLIGLYNLEVVDESGQARVISFRLPSLAQASIFHEPLQLDPASLTQKELRRLEECNTRLIAWGPLPQVESLNAQNRLKVMTALWFIFNRHLSHLHKSAIEKLCRICSKLVVQGFPRSGGMHTAGSSNRLPPRIPVSTQFLLELLHAIYFAMFNEFSSMAVQALEDIQFRGCYECFTEVILVAGAVRNSIKDTPTGQTLEGPMGISMAVTPATTTVTVSKSMITNASFRTKKLPDDIPIQAPADSTQSPETKDQKDGKNLTSISEEQEDTPRSSARRVTGGMSLQKLALVGKRGPASRGRKVTPPSQSKGPVTTNVSKEKPLTNGDTYEMDSMARKNGLDENITSVDCVEKDSDSTPESAGIQSTPISLLEAEAIQNSNKTSNDIVQDVPTPSLVSRKNDIEVEHTRGVMQVSTV